MLEYGIFTNVSTVFPPILCKKIVVPTESVLILFSTPFILITGSSNKIIVVEKCFVTKQAGIAYTTVGVTSLDFSYSTGANPNWNSITTANLVGFLDVAPLSIVILNRCTTSSQTVVDKGSTGRVGANLLLDAKGANPAAGTGDLIVWLTFRVWDVTSLAWF